MQSNHAMSAAPAPVVTLSMTQRPSVSMRSAVAVRSSRPVPASAASASERDGDERVEAQQHVVIGGGTGHRGGVLAVGPMPVGKVQRLERAAAVEQVVQAGAAAAHDGGVVVGAVEVGQRGVVLEPAVHGGRAQLEAGDAVEHGVGVHALVLDVGEGDFPRKRGDGRVAEPARKRGDLAVGVGVGLAGLGLVKAHGQDLAAGVVVPPGVVVVLEAAAQDVGPDVDGTLAVTHAMGVGGVAVALHEVGRGAVPRVGGVGRVLGLVDDAQPGAVRRAARVGGGKVVEARIPQGHGAVEDQRLERLAAGEHVGAVHGVDGAHLPVVDVHDVEALATLEHVGEARDVAHGQWEMLPTIWSLVSPSKRPSRLVVPDTSTP